MSPIDTLFLFLFLFIEKATYNDNFNSQCYYRAGFHWAIFGRGPQSKPTTQLLSEVGGLVWSSSGR